MNVALIYDRVNKWGGAERVLLALHEIWPQAPLYTAVYDPVGAPWADVFDVRPSFLQHVPLAKTHHELFPWLTPFAFESFSFDEFDVVISVTSAEAKNIITKPDTLHICYCLTPTRYLWSGYEAYQSHPGWGVLSGIARQIHARMTARLRKWDQYAATRPDVYVAISRLVASRIKAYYGQDVDAVIYPPVDLEKFKGQNLKVKSSDYFLLVSRLVGYKRVDIVIEAFTKLQLPLIVIGDGRERAELVRQAGKNITFVFQRLTDQELAHYYQRCHAFVFAGQEDFGLVALEAQACGKPVIAYRHSGIGEIVQDKKTGILYDEQSVDALIQALSEFRKHPINRDMCRQNAKRFDKKDFEKEFLSFVQKRYETQKKI